MTKETNRGNINVCMISYSEYYTDARIKSYVECLKAAGIKTCIYCLEDSHSKSEEGEFLKVIFVQKKYQGESTVKYILSYLKFFFLAYFMVTVGFFRYRFSVFHVHNIPDFIVYCAFLPKIFGRKIILDMHDAMSATFDTKNMGGGMGLVKFLIRVQTRLSLFITSALILANHGQKEYMEKRGVTHRDSHVFLNLPSSVFFAKRDSVPDGVELKLIYHGTITKRLGVDIIIKAVEEASAKSKVVFTLIGDGELKNELVSYCDEKGLTGKSVVFKPFIKVDKLKEEIEKHDAGIIGNRRSELTEEIMLPVKLMEYLSVGLPVITPRLRVIEKYFDDSMVLFYEPDDTKELSEKIVYMYENKAGFPAMSANSSKFFDKYNWDNQEKDYLALIRKYAR